MASDTSARSVEQLTAIIESVPTAIIMVDGRGVIALVNAQAERLFGYTRKEVLGEMVDILVPHRFRAGHPALRTGFFHSPTVRPMGAGRDLFGLRKDGTEFPIEIGLNPITTDEGLFVVSAIVDISERKRLEARFRATVESAPTAMVMIDQAGTIVLVNAETERLFGYSRGKLVDQKVEVLIPARFRGGHPYLRSQYFASSQARRMGAGRDLYGLRLDGSEFPIEIGLNPVTTDQGMFVLSAIVDITERKRQNEELKRSNEALERSNLESQRFAYFVSHDLQTPLRSIASFVQLLQSTYAGKLDSQAHDWIGRTVRSVEYLQTLIKDLLAYSRVDSQAHPFQRVPFGDIVGDAMSLLETPIRESGAEVSVDESHEVMGDRAQLVQLLMNLIGNAIKYRGSESPRIYVKAERVGDEEVFSVCDNGIGIAPRHHERIFEIFRRLHDAGEYPGTGIGLAICRRVVHRHGGRIWVESEAGKGSAFKFTLPGPIEAIHSHD
jgi:PAS domain S-box-containing protein